MEKYDELIATCKRKIQYKSKELADGAAKKHAAGVPYQCHWCGMWHLTTQSAWCFYDDECGKRFGKFTVRYRLTCAPMRYSCWCDCGEREIRSSKAINNPANCNDSCAKCRDAEFKRKKTSQMEESQDKVCQHCRGSGVMPKALIAPEPPDVKCRTCNGTGKAIRFDAHQFYAGNNAIGGHSGHGGGLD